MAGHVKVMFAARFREIVGQREILEEVGLGTTLGDLLTTFAEKYGRDFNKIIDSKTGKISLETWVMVNGESVRRMDIELKDNDVILVSVPASGG